MRARFAYISSLGTTAILIAAALLMLALVSALVAYRGWPGGAGDGGVQAIPLVTGQATRPVALVRHPGDQKTTTFARDTVRVAARFSASASRFVKLGSTAKGPRTVPGLVMVPATGSPAQQRGTTQSPEPQQPVTPSSAAADVPPGTQHQPGSPLPSSGGGSLPVPLPDVTGTIPTTDQVTSAVGGVLSGGGPPPPVLAVIFHHHR